MRLLVTGAAGGIGAAIVSLAVERGHEVLAHDLRQPDEICADVEALSGNLLDAEHLRALAAIAQARRIEAIVAAHGIAGAGSLAELDAERVRAILEVNAATIPRLFGAVRATLAAQHGRYVVITSQAALRAERDNAAYCASKWAAQAWVLAQAALEGENGIAIRALCPGRTHTPLLDDAMRGFAEAVGQSVKDYTEQIHALVPLGRFATTRETAAAALFLAATGPRPTVLAETGGEVPF